VGTMTPLIRLAIGLLQGVALLMLYQASEHKTWPATDAFVFAPLATIATFVALIVISALGHVRWRALLAWAVVATLLCAGLAVYDIFRNSVAVAGDAAVTTDLMHILPSGSCGGRWHLSCSSSIP
jgi:cell division protein FtsW (lipid II flippase)